uniref:Spondin-1 n=1 Tax=Salarias fasciatus TaxID=181472 RepID=A0A672GF67_SALFA
MEVSLRLPLLPLLLLCASRCSAGSAVEEPPGAGRSSDGFCGRILRAQTQGTRRDGYHEFRLRVEGDPETYQPGTTSRVVLLAASPAYFRGFTLVALKEGRDGAAEQDHLGRFQIVDQEDTQFMADCPPAVTESSPRRRTRIQVLWTAPSSGSGCVILKASIVQKRTVYFQEEGSLTVRLCEKERAAGEATDGPADQCCACGAAKYRLTFYGNWSEKVHPRDYPRRANHWSALIGASHSRNYILWQYGGLASEGVRQVAELGSPVRMEEEIRQKGDLVLTVIKTKAQWPAWQPLNMRAPPSAEFSVDRTRHLMSFLTMLGPSPDWNVGLSAEDLCSQDCGWVQRLEADLVPWDAGTDGGVTYESPNQPTVPQEKIRPLTSLDHPQSPFYDPEGGAITPLARVVVERIARKVKCLSPDTAVTVTVLVQDGGPRTCLYSHWRRRQRMLKAQLDPGRACPHTQDFQACMGPGCSEGDTPTCMMSEWISWSSCSVSCGMGTRSRERYVKQYPEDGSLCQLHTQETDRCVVCCSAPSSCVVTEWAEWDACSATCGMGVRRRERMVKMAPTDGSMCETPLAELEKCLMPECRSAPCMLSPWSDWTRCSVTCGLGVRTRDRMLKSDPAECGEELQQMEKCMLPECPVDCMVSEWSDWSQCNKSCGKGHTVRTRMVKLEPQFGGDVCPETIQRKKCKLRKCRTNSKMEGGGEQEEETRKTWTRRSSGARCRMQPWTSWTDCTKPCGGGVQERFLKQKKGAPGSRPAGCQERKEIRACNSHPC